MLSPVFILHIIHIISFRPTCRLLLLNFFWPGYTGEVFGITTIPTKKSFEILRKMTYCFKYDNNALTPFCFSGSEYSLCGKLTSEERERAGFDFNNLIYGAVF
jgi:hypothetical protein